MPDAGSLRLSSLVKRNTPVVHLTRASSISSKIDRPGAKSRRQSRTVAPTSPPGTAGPGRPPPTRPRSIRGTRLPVDNDLVALAFVRTAARRDVRVRSTIGRIRPALSAVRPDRGGRPSLGREFSPTGRVLVIGAMRQEFRGVVNLWRLGRRLPGRINEPAEINSVAVRPVKRALAWATTDGRVVLYHLDRGRIPLPGPSHYGVVASPRRQPARSRRRLGANSRLGRGTTRRGPRSADRAVESATDIAFSPDGRGLAVANGTRSYAICDVPPAGSCTPLRRRAAGSPGSPGRRGRPHRRRRNQDRAEAMCAHAPGSRGAG